MEFARVNKDKIEDLHNKGLSTYEIAEALGTYSTRVIRAMDYLGIERRNYKEAQKVAIKRGRSAHPTKGRKLSKDHRNNIGAARSHAYAILSDEEKSNLAEMNKQRWDALGEEKRAAIRELAWAACRMASREGSKTERYLQDKLTEDGYTVEFHKTGMVLGSQLEIDLFLPEVKTAIEIDGPSHFRPIWGEEKMQKQQNADTTKQGLILGHGFTILRIRQYDKNISITRLNFLLQCVREQLKEIEAGDGKPRLIEIEVKDGKSRRI